MGGSVVVQKMPAIYPNASCYQASPHAAVPCLAHAVPCHAVLCCAVQVDALVFGHLLQGGFPTLWRHLASLDVDAASVIMPWFLVGFLNSLPLDSVLRGGSRVPAQLVLAGAAWCCWCVVVSCGSGIDSRHLHADLRRLRWGQDTLAEVQTSLPALPRCTAPVCVCMSVCATAVWDLLFFEGSPVVLFRVALALIEIYEQVGGWVGGRVGGWVGGWVAPFVGFHASISQQ